MVRQPSGKGSARKSGAPLDESVEPVEADLIAGDVVEQSADEAALDADELHGDELSDDEREAELESTPDPGGTTRSIATDKFWSRVRVQPVEIALPAGVGYTLRAYRLSTELTPTEAQVEEDDYDLLRGAPDEDLDVDGEPDVLSPEEQAAFERSFEDDDDDDRRARSAKDSDEAVEAEADEDEDEDDEDDDEDEDDGKKAKPEEVPAFLSHRGRLLLFRSADGLAEFLRSDAPHDLTQLDTWDKVRERVSAVDIAPTAEDRYELDLVVENLRGGPDVWDVDLLIQAGELARDVAYALRMKSVVGALAAGSPLDDLDEALRGAANGGVGGFFARRRLRKIGAQQAAIGWRTIIGKISAAVDWRD